MNINELREKRAKVWENTKSFLESHRSEKGTLSAADENTYNAMMADIIDYELDRSGKFIPAAVTGTYSFIDKLVSSFSAAIATGLVALIGYTSTMPQPSDSSTPAIFWMTMSLYFGLPLIGWVCTLCAMRKTPLSKEKMEEVQKSIQEKKQAEVEKVIDEMK